MKEPGYRNRIQELDALRGLAVIIVFLFHCTLTRPHSNNWFRLGVTGVDLFFMISGFVITLTLSRTSHWKEFVVNRLSRLFPTYWACVTFTFIFILIRHFHSSLPIPDLLIKYLGNLTMFQRYLGIGNLDEQYWTMEIEMLFYLIMLLVYLFKKLDSIETIGYISLIFIIAYDSILELHFPGLYVDINQNFPLINHFPLFFAGILFYKIKNEGGTLFRYLGVVLCFVITCMLFNNGGRSMHYINYPEYMIMVSVYFLLFVLTLGNHLKFLTSKLLLLLGKVSYSFYLIHQYVSSKIVIPGLQNYLGLNFITSVLAAFLVSFTLASFITFYIEDPCLRYLRPSSKKQE